MFNKAIVIGGSIAGKLAAKALSSTFKEVIIIEAGERWDGKSSRKRVPQSNHPHVLLKGGEKAIEELFPTITNELIETGSIVNNFTRDIKWHQFGLWKQQFIGKVHMIQQSRFLLEWHIQKRIDDISNVTTKYGTSVEGLLIDGKRNKVCGVKAKCLETGTQEEIQADIVVDASGFGSKSIAWLREYNIEVQEEKARIDLFYATRMFKLKGNEKLDCCNMLMSPSFPDNPYGVLIQTIEDNRYFVTFSGYANEKAPQTDDEFYDFAENLSISNVTDFLNKAEAISNIKTYKIPYQVRRRFDLVNHLPEGLLVVGDAHCRFDPVFGQGVSVAAMEAHQLQLLLQKRQKLDKTFTQRFYKKTANIIQTPWEMTTTEISRHPQLTRKLSMKQKFQLWYTKQIYELSATDSDVYIRLVRVMNLIRSPLHLFHPKVLLAVLLKRKN
ncbi:MULTISPECIES: FAD-dependent oxidoreductase [Bacillus cereus group]|uniref:NADPH-dependent glutamate synthase beta chain and oxidoreductase n=1 Tax=Bacillus thuringiensis TaxID=1428 RepID=A0A1C4EDE6_BACTU|nr:MULTISPECIES: FAD/NAD(P)-binding protein [Bacillus cereus group]MCU5499667.1 FAD-dependent oxidoreductase [Bacillus wiedmannii]MED3025837.1 FAD-dependent oxidoreductase [Bacillus wiedmannii]OTY03133.1 glutamate synthase [Bacillus thuringiensis serovar wratislaviensis]OUB58792.1 glutamate synthase [Bacillus thuringiensis serovar sylvestriensis]PFY93816.1 FAD-dependent oxidoreductase [Bacillus wiedmannii]